MRCLQLQLPFVHEALAHRQARLDVDREGDELHRSLGDARFVRGADLHHEHGGSVEAEPGRAWPLIPNDREPEVVLIERDEAIDLIGAEREMVQAHDESEDARPGRAAEEADGLVDAHCHLDFPDFDADRDAVLRRARAAGVTRLVIAGYSPATFARALALRDEAIRVCAGLHPWALAESAESEDDATLARLEELAERADAIGEIGLDAPLAKRSDATLERQVRVAREGLAIARRIGLPVVLHVVGAHEAMLELCETVRPTAGGMVHGFSGSAEQAARWVRAGFSLSFGGSVTHARHRRVRAAACAIPLERLLIESDAPDANPEGFAGRNEPSRLRAVLASLAGLRSTDEALLARATAENAERLFFAASGRGRIADGPAVC